MTTTDDMISILREYAADPRRADSLEAVLDELPDASTGLAGVLEEATELDWHHAALEGLRLLASKGRLSPAEGEVVLRATRDVALQFGIDEYYKSLDALAFSSETAPLLVDFAKEQLHRPSLRDGRWLAFFAVATLLQHRPEAVVPYDLGEQLIVVSTREPDSPRKQQMSEIAEMCLASSGRLKEY